MLMGWMQLIKGKVDILLVDVNQEIFNAKIHGCNLFIQKCPQCLWDKYIISDDLLPVNWKLLSIIENLTEEQAAGLVNRMQPHVTLFGDFFENYIDSELMYESPISSFHSLLKANDAGDFNPKTTLILIKT